MRRLQVPDKLTTTDKVESLEYKVEEMEKHYFAFIKGMGERTEELNDRNAAEEREWRAQTIRNQDGAKKHNETVKIICAIEAMAMCCIAILLAVHLSI